MRRVLIVGLLVLSCGACTRFAGPIAVRHMGPADAPGYTIEEQEKRGRARLAITEDDWAIGPAAYIARPSPIGR